MEASGKVYDFCLSFNGLKSKANSRLDLQPEMKLVNGDRAFNCSIHQTELIKQALDRYLSSLIAVTLADLGTCKHVRNPISTEIRLAMGPDKRLFDIDILCSVGRIR